jgi:ribosomal protein S3
MRSFYVDEILRDWKAESKVTHLMLYRIKNGVLTVYTDRPGSLIGRLGERITRFTDKLKAVPFPNIKEVKLEETDGIF